MIVGCRAAAPGGALAPSAADAIEHLDHSGAERIVLGPLEDDAVAQVAEDVIDAEPDDALLDLVKGAHGSPFVLTELLSGLRDEDLVRVVAGRAELVEARLPRRVRFTMRERLRSVSAPAREAATVAASLGRRFSFADLANMLDRPPATLLGPVDELVDSGMLVESGDRLAFRHDVTRETVRESVPVSGSATTAPRMPRRRSRTALGSCEGSGRRSSPSGARSTRRRWDLAGASRCSGIVTSACSLTTRYSASHPSRSSTYCCPISRGLPPNHVGRNELTTRSPTAKRVTPAPWPRSDRVSRCSSARC